MSLAQNHYDSIYFIIVTGKYSYLWLHDKQQEFNLCVWCVG